MERSRQGKAPKPGEIFRQPNLARTWRNLSKHGRDYYYSGELARKIVAASDSGGGYLKLPDLASQRSEWMDPVSTLYRGYRHRNASQRTGSHCSYDAADSTGIRHRWYLPERPRCGGAPDFGSTKLSFADAERYIGDPRFGEVDVEQLLSNDFIASRRGKIRIDEAVSTPAAGQLRGDTTYFTVVDKDRNAVSFITSISDVFGSGIVVGDTGIIMHNRAAEFSLEAGHPNEVAPGKRPRHSILPSMLFQGDKLHMSFGCMGATRAFKRHREALAEALAG